jgi:hypothetical protein
VPGGRKAVTTEQMRERVQPYDWTFSTDYAGTLVHGVDGHVRSAFRNAPRYCRCMVLPVPVLRMVAMH